MLISMVRNSSGACANMIEGCWLQMLAHSTRGNSIAWLSRRCWRTPHAAFSAWKAPCLVSQGIDSEEIERQVELFRGPPPEFAQFASGAGLQMACVLGALGQAWRRASEPGSNAQLQEVVTRPLLLITLGVRI